MDRLADRLRERLERTGYAARYRLADLSYAVGVATPTRTVAGAYWSYEPTNAHGDDPGLAALDALADDATVLDVGAHVGEYAVPLARGTGRRVVAFEPDPLSAARLGRTVARNGVRDRVDVRRVAVGATDGTRPFYRSSFSKLSSLDPAHAGAWGATVEAVETVPVRRIDDLVGESVPAPDGIKIDVEGAADAVLRGAERTIESHRPLLVVERHPDDRRASIRERLTDRGYAIEPAADAWICRPETADG